MVDKDYKPNPLISEETIKLLQYRIEQEDLSSRMYLAMSLCLNNMGYECHTLWKKYSEEEASHADWAREYLLSFSILPKTCRLEDVTCEVKDLAEVIKNTYDHEVEVTIQCKELAKHAMEEGDYMLYTLASKYLAEQREEISKSQTLLDKLESFGTDKIALKLLDQELAR